MVDVAQLVRAPVCGTGGRGFKSRHPPQMIFSDGYLIGDFLCLTHIKTPGINRGFLYFYKLFYF